MGSPVTGAMRIDVLGDVPGVEILIVSVAPNQCLLERICRHLRCEGLRRACRGPVF